MYVTKKSSTNTEDSQFPLDLKYVTIQFMQISFPHVAGDVNRADSPRY